MTKFVEGVELESTTCGVCGVLFAMPSHILRGHREKHTDFYCPSGHCLVFRGKSEADKLRDELARAQSQITSRDARIHTLAQERNAISKAHRKMRTRVMNGVCPCCNRSFENLRRHMQTEHADFGTANTLKALREAFGMTQADVASEAFVNVAYVSKYEHGKPVPAEAAESLNWWVEHQGKRA